jgi:hypothetical protein
LKKKVGNLSDATLLLGVKILAPKNRSTSNKVAYENSIKMVTSQIPRKVSKKGNTCFID